MKERMLAATALLALGAMADGFTLVGKETRARVVVGADEPGYVFRAAQDFTNDVKKITGADLALTRGNAPRPGDVFISTTGGSRLSRPHSPGGSRSCATDPARDARHATCDVRGDITTFRLAPVARRMSLVQQHPFPPLRF